MLINYFSHPIIIHDDCIKHRGSFTMNAQVHDSESIIKVIELLKETNKPVLLDVGACTGSYALIDILIDCEIYSFEPVNTTFQLLEYNIKKNNSSTKCFNIAISDYSGIGILHEVNYMGGIALSMIDGKPSFSRHKHIKKNVIVNTLDNICNEKNIIPSLIKIDVEGNEYAVINGAKETINKYKPIIFFEYSIENQNQYNKGFHEIKQLLEDYKLIQFQNENVICLPN